MKTKKEKVRLTIVIVLLLSCIGCLYYYFFVKLNGNWMFWKQNTINWKSIEYDDDFFPLDTVEVYGEYGEWKFKEFKPIYAGYGTTEDDLNYLIGKYLDDEGKEQTVKVLVSGEGMVDWPYPDNSFLEFYNSYYKNNVAIRGESYDPEKEIEVDAEDLVYDDDDAFLHLLEQYEYSCPPEVILTNSELEEEYGEVPDSYAGYNWVEADNAHKYCDFLRLFYNSSSAEVVETFSFVTEKLEIGDQFSVKYLETQKEFVDCKYEYTEFEKILCANQLLNETYDNYLVGIYIEID